MARRSSRPSDSFAPELSTTRQKTARVRLAKNATEFEAGSVGTRRTVGWHAPTSSPNNGLLGNLTTLRDRSRAAVRNDGYAKGVIEKLVTNIIGTGIQPRSQATDPVFRAAADRLFLKWTDESDADGLLDFYGQQTQAVRGWLEGGEQFVRFRFRDAVDGLSVPLQLQLLEPELCPHSYSVPFGASRIRAGIEFSPIGKRVAYYFHPSRPELDDYDASQLRRVPSDSVIHLYDPLRAGQLRGLPHLTQALVALYELSKYSDAQLIRQQLSNMFVAFVKKDATPDASEPINPLTDGAVETSAADEPMVPLAPGLFQQLNPGEDVTFSSPPEANGYADFMRQQLYGVAAATGVPYEVITGDMRSVNDRTVRLILQEFRRRIQAWQHQIVVFQFGRRVYRTWMDRAVLSGALRAPVEYWTNPDPWVAVDWQPQGWPYMNPVQDVQAAREEVRAGFRSRRAVVSERGDSVEAIDAEQAADNKRSDDLGLQYDSDGRKPAGAAASTAAMPELDDPAKNAA